MTVSQENGGRSGRELLTAAPAVGDFPGPGPWYSLRLEGLLDSRVRRGSHPQLRHMWWYVFTYIVVSVCRCAFLGITVICLCTF